MVQSKQLSRHVVVGSPPCKFACCVRLHGRSRDGIGRRRAPCTVVAVAEVAAVVAEATAAVAVAAAAVVVVAVAAVDLAGCQIRPNRRLTNSGSQLARSQTQSNGLLPGCSRVQVSPALVPALSSR